MKWCIFLHIILSLSFNIVDDRGMSYDWGMSFLLRIILVRVQLLFCDNGLRRLYSMVEVLWIGWLLFSWVPFWCLRLRVVKVLGFAAFFSGVTLRRMYQICFWLFVALTWLNMAHYHWLFTFFGFSK